MLKPTYSISSFVLCMFSAGLSAVVTVLVLFFLFIELDLFEFRTISVLNIYEVREAVETTNSISPSDLKVLEKLEAQGLIDTPDRFLSHLSSYYNALIAFLGIFIAGIGLITIWFANLKVKYDVEMYVRSNPDLVINSIRGKVEDLVREEVDKLNAKSELYSSKESEEVI